MLKEDEIKIINYIIKTRRPFNKNKIKFFIKTSPSLSMHYIDINLLSTEHISLLVKLAPTLSLVYMPEKLSEDDILYAIEKYPSLFVTIINDDNIQITDRIKQQIEDNEKM